MSFQNWDKVQALFYEAADLAPEEQSRFLNQACGSDADLRREVESLLDSDRFQPHDIGNVLEDVAQQFLGADPVLGERFGAWRVVDEIGRGGMAVVYRAVRDDDQFRKQAALKLIKYGMDSAEQLGRFRHERQILANLDHPFIARLIDGGATALGRPYLVMEYVGGQAIDEWCREHNPSVEDICRLMLQVCEAVSYAHRNLVVHRDLKPGNILVVEQSGTGTRTPKLLDFGVAKLLSPGITPLDTTLVGRALTPEYASPEQVRGDAVTTATDVYSLGAVLYELLAGTKAHRVTSATVEDMQRAICLTETVRPSDAVDSRIPNAQRRRKQLSGDLDNIVLMAMRKEAERRYASVDEFAGDLRRYLEGRPVRARQDSFAYRAGKFVRRRRYGLLAAGLVFASLIAGLVVTLSESRKAQAERRIADGQRAVAVRERSAAEASRQSEAEQRLIADEQRDQAVQERARAERRLTDLLHLADNTLFDIHDAVATLPGSVAARQTIVRTTLDYLEGMQREAGLDDGMRVVLSGAYLKVGNVQGAPDAPSLQDSAGADKSYLKAEALLAPVYSRRSEDPEILNRWILIESARAELAANSDRPQRGLDAFLKILPLAHRLGQLQPNEKLAAKCEASICQRLASVTSHKLGMQDRAMAYSMQSIDLMRAVVARFPTESDLQADLALSVASLASSRQNAADLAGAAENYLEAIRLRERLLQTHPTDVDVRRNLLINYGNYATLLGMPWSANLGRFAEARVYTEKSVALARDLAKADPLDVTAQFNLGVSLTRAGMIEPEPAHVAESLSRLQEGLGIMEPIAKADPRSTTISVQIALGREYTARRLDTLGRRTEAAQLLQKALSDIEPFLGPGAAATMIVQSMRNGELMAEVQAELGDRAAAMRYADQVLSLAKSYLAVDPKSDRRLTNVANAHYVRGSVLRTFGEWAQARPELEQALNMWSSIHDAMAMAIHRQNFELAGQWVKDGR